MAEYVTTTQLFIGRIITGYDLLARVRDPVDDAGCGMGDQLEIGGVADPADWAVRQLRLAAPADNVAARAAEHLQTKVDRQTGHRRGYRAGADGGEADRTLD